MSDLVERLRRGIHHPGYVIGQHWMSVAYDRICAGESQDSVMSDYGFVRSAEIEQLRAERDQWKSGSAIVNDRLLAEIERLQARCAELEETQRKFGALMHEQMARAEDAEKDAARYRWLKGRSEDYCGHVCFPEVAYRNKLQYGQIAATVDAAIDAAMEAKP